MGFRAQSFAALTAAASMAVVVLAAGCSAIESFDGLAGPTGEGGVTSTGAEGGTSRDASSTDTGTIDQQDDGSVQAKKDGGGSGAFDCNGDTVSDCSSCNGKPQPCITCDSMGNTSSFCDSAGANCRNDATGDFVHGCACKAPDDCPGSFQVCFNKQFCHTCGEPNSNGAPCVGGSTCNAMQAACK